MTGENDKDPIEAFHRALRGLSRTGVPVEQADEKVTPPEEPKCDVREALMDEILAKHPGLTRNALSKQMAEMGF